MYRVENHRLKKHNFDNSYLDSEDNIYYDVTIQNQTNINQLAVYNKTEKKMIVDNPNDYYLTVLKFDIPSTALPIFEFKPETYSFISSYNGFIETTFVQLVPQGDIGGNLIYNYSAFIEMINITLRQHFIDLYNTTGGTLPVLNPNTNPVPQLIYTNDREPIIFRFPIAYIETSGIDVRMNYALFRFFQNFQNFFNSSTGSTLSNTDDYTIRVYDTGNNYLNITTGPYTGEYYDMRQDCPTFYLWWEIKDILVTTTLPINQEVIGTLDDKGDYKSLQILVDHTIEKRGTPGTERMDILYRPEPQYKLIDLMGTIPISNVGFQFKYRTKDLRLIDLPLYPGDNLYMKLLFVKKELFSK